MKVLRFFGKMILGLCLLALVVLPLGLIYEISQREMEQYAVPEIPVFQESAYGKLYQAARMDIYETVTVSGSFQSYSYTFMELEQRYPDRIRWFVDVGQEIREGDVLGVYMGDDVVSTVSGVLVSMQTYGSEPHLKVKLLEPAELECNVAGTVLTQLKNARELKTEQGVAAEVTYIASVKNADGTTTIRLKLAEGNYRYGDQLRNLVLLTGNAYLRVLVVPEICLYQKVSGEDEPWFLRHVSSDGTFIDEVEVGRGIKGGGMVSVTGIQEGQWFDGGYKQVLEGDQE